VNYFELIGGAQTFARDHGLGLWGACGGPGMPAMPAAHQFDGLPLMSRHLNEVIHPIFDPIR
jgi:hypothetical protein